MPEPRPGEATRTAGPLTTARMCSREGRRTPQDLHEHVTARTLRSHGKARSTTDLPVRSANHWTFLPFGSTCAFSGHNCAAHSEPVGPRVAAAASTRPPIFIGGKRRGELHGWWCLGASTRPPIFIGGKVYGNTSWGVFLEASPYRRFSSAVRGSTPNRCGCCSCFNEAADFHRR